MRLLADQGPVVAPPAGEEVFRALRRMILSGELRHGEHLVERRVAETLHVSRTPVREALRKLEAEGLVRREAYRSLVVASLSAEDIVEISRIREVLEGLAAELAASRCSRSQLRTLRSLLSRMEKSFPGETAGPEHEAFTRLHAEFHDTLSRASESPRLYHLLSTLRDYLESFATLGYRQLGRTRQACVEHQAIVERIAAGDAEAAAETARAHVRHSKEALLAVLGDLPSSGPSSVPGSGFGLGAGPRS